MRPLTETEIRGSILNAGPEESDRMPVPGLHETIWADREYLGWRDPGSPQRGYVVYWRGDEPVGLALRAAETRLTAGSAICSLCATIQPADQVTMFTAARPGRFGDSVGTYICADLACSLLIRMTPRARDLQPDPRDLVASKVDGLATRLDAFARRVLDPA